MIFQRLFILFFLLSAFISNAQIVDSKKNIVSKYVDNMLNDTNDLSAPKFMTYPTLAYSPETKWEFGLSSLYIYLANRDLNNRLSEVKAFTFYTLENQYGLWLDHALYTDKNTWFFLGKSRYQNFPLLYYGIGLENNTGQHEEVQGEFTLFRQRFMREFFDSFYTGLEFDFQRLNNVNSELSKFIRRPIASTNLGVGWGFLYNNIHNAMNPRNGFFSEWAFLNYHKKLGSEFNLQSYIIDNRFYYPVSTNNVLAGQLYGQFTTGDAPFNLISLLGGENLMRGYYLGRYRDKHMIAGQIEYRMLPFGFSKRFGGSIFLAAGQVFSEENKFQWRKFLPTGGAGLRFLVFPEKDIYTRLDVSFTKEGNGIYLLIGEAF